MTAGHLCRLREDAGQARESAREVRGQADAAWVRHVREVWELTSRAEAAESDVVVLREHQAEIEAELKAVRQKPVRLVLLLKYGEPHSVHASVHAAEEHAQAQGAVPSGWGPSTGAPSHRVAWRTVTLTLDGGAS
ncbi:MULTISPECIES: hypothetical protein [unclassified Streptomyces]|uniref:hypothetical protein n=1 Tax=unclassified Streptomyces TaxID=2593676 RepID=UPI00381004E2